MDALQSWIATNLAESVDSAIALSAVYSAFKASLSAAAFHDWPKWKFERALADKIANLGYAYAPKKVLRGYEWATAT